MTSRTKKTLDSPNFESILKSLTGLVERLENEELSMDQSLAAFETGIALCRTAQHSLADAEQKVRMLVERSGDPACETFGSDEGPAG